MKKITGWISVEDRLPEESERVLVTIDPEDPFVGIDIYEAGDWNNWNRVIAWMPLPEPYRPGISNTPEICPFCKDLVEYKDDFNGYREPYRFCPACGRKLQKIYD